LRSDTFSDPKLSKTISSMNLSISAYEDLMVR
jgi:hypothetical protein